MNDMGHTVLIIGATGLVGSEILSYSLQDERVSSVRIFVRKSTDITHPKLNEFIVDFNKIEDWREELQGETLFSAMGTTLKLAGTRDLQRIVDYEYQLRVAQAAKLNGTTNFILVSAPYAHPKSPFAYTQMKGELERDIMKLSFPKLTIIRPGLLKGPRKHQRFVEQTSAKILDKLPTIPGFEAMKPVSGKLVAHACMESAFDSYRGQRILGPRDILEFLR